MMAPTRCLQAMLRTVLLMLAVCGDCRGDYLVFGGSGAGTPGLWAGVVDRRDIQGNKTDLYTAGYTCALWDDATGSQLVKDIQVLSMSYDLWTTQVLLQLAPTSPDLPGRVTVAAGPLCAGPASCSRPAPLLLWDAVSSTGEAGPFAWYNSQLYFVLRHQEQVKPGAVNGTGNRTWVELRRSETCQDAFPFRQGRFDLEQCSSRMAILYDGESDGEDVFPGRHLLLVPTALGRFAFVVLFRVPREGGTSTPQALLVEVAMATAKHPMGKVTIRHQSHLSITSVSTAMIQQAGVGGVDFLENRLCWSTLETVWCAWWDVETFNDIRRLVNSTDVRDMCTQGTLGEEALFSGVAIATTYHPFKAGNLTIYAGCQSSQNTSVGGAFLYHVTSTSQSLQAVTSKHGQVNARSMFFAARANGACPTVAPPTEGPGGGDGGGGGPGGGGGAGGKGGATKCKCEVIITVIAALMASMVIQRHMQ